MKTDKYCRIECGTYVVRCFTLTEVEKELKLLETFINNNLGYPNKISVTYMEKQPNGIYSGRKTSYEYCIQNNHWKTVSK